MDTLVILMIVSVVGAAALFVALGVYLNLIIGELEAIGGPRTRFNNPHNFLAKIRLGLRAIEVETGHLAPQVTKLNAGLGAVRDGLQVVDANLGGVIAAVSKQVPR